MRDLGSANIIYVLLGGIIRGLVYHAVTHDTESVVVDI